MSPPKPSFRAETKALRTRETTPTSAFFIWPCLLPELGRRQKHSLFYKIGQIHKSVRTRPMDFYPLTENAARQAIDSSTVFYELRRALPEARTYRGGMYWKSQGAYEYLVKTAPDNRQSRLGPRTAETESIYATFTSNKKNAEARVKSLRGAVREAERLNKALRVGRMPALVVSILHAFDQAGLANDLTVVDTHALFA
jgi:hypothetical protein